MTRRHSSNEAPRTLAAPSPSRSLTSDLRQYVSKRRWWLAFGAVLVFIAMVVGIVFAAHKHYVGFGGQGFLKARALNLEPTPLHTTKVFLPLRPVVINREEATALEMTRRSPANVPFYTCGDQQHSCEGYNQPNICCPVRMFCYPTPFTPSKIFCCNSTSKSDCHSSNAYPPKCLNNTFECSKEMAGGCCPHGTICVSNGCIEITGPSIISGSSTAKPTAGSYVFSSTIVDGSAASGSGLMTVSTFTVTERPAATSTGVKQGEVAQNGVPQRDSVFLTLCLPHVSALVLVCIAAMMGFLY